MHVKAHLSHVIVYSVGLGLLNIYAVLIIELPIAKKRER